MLRSAARDFQRLRSITRTVAKYGYAEFVAGVGQRSALDQSRPTESVRDHQPQALSHDA